MNIVNPGDDAPLRSRTESVSSVIGSIAAIAEPLTRDHLKVGGVALACLPRLRVWTTPGVWISTR